MLVDDRIAALPVEVDRPCYAGWLVWIVDGQRLRGLTNAPVWEPGEPATSKGGYAYPGVQAVVGRAAALQWLSDEYYGEQTIGHLLVLGEVVVWGGPHVVPFRRGTFGYPLSFEGVIDCRDRRPRDSWKPATGWVPLVQPDHGLVGNLRGTYGVPR